MKAFKKLSTAKQYAGDLPIIQVGDVYIVGESKRDLATTNISVIAKNSFGHNVRAGFVSVSKLVALGNANWAAQTDKSGYGSEKIEIDWYDEKAKENA